VRTPDAGQAARAAIEPEAIVIPPSLLNIGYYFSLLPIYEQEPAPTSPSPAPADVADAEPGSAAANPATGGDADGINDQVALRMVFKGYKLIAVPQWEAQANSGYEHAMDNRADDSEERRRQDQRARSTVHPQPPAATNTEQPGAAATPDDSAP
jgi:hypothetical protein